MAIVYRVGKFILLSSDKAVFPTGVMGMTKALAEKAMIAKSRNSLNTTLCAVRFGNLIDSRGMSSRYGMGRGLGMSRLPSPSRPPRGSL